MEGNLLNSIFGKIGEPLHLAEKKSNAIKMADEREVRELARSFKANPEVINDMEAMIDRARSHVDAAAAQTITEVPAGPQPNSEQSKWDLAA